MAEGGSQIRKRAKKPVSAANGSAMKARATEGCAIRCTANRFPQRVTCPSPDRVRRDRIALPEVIQCSHCLLPVVPVHGVPARELPAFIREQPERRLPLRKKPGQPFKGGFCHRPVGRGEAQQVPARARQDRPARQSFSRPCLPWSHEGCRRARPSRALARSAMP